MPYGDLHTIVCKRSLRRVRTRTGGALMFKRFLNSRLSVVLILAFYAALGWMVAMEVTK